MATPLQTVTFNGQELAVIPQKDKLLVAIKPICENIGIDWSSQLKRIKRDEVLDSNMVMMTTVAGDGKSRSLLCLPMEYLNGWLFCIDSNRIKNPEVKARVIEYKKECYQALFSYWTQGIAVNPRIKTKGQPKPGCLSLDQQDEIKAVVQARLEELPQNCRGKAALTCWSALKSKFGCHYKEIGDEDYSEALSLVARLPLEDVKPLLGSQQRGNVLQIELTIDVFT